MREEIRGPEKLARDTSAEALPCRDYPCEAVAPLGLIFSR